VARDLPRIVLPLHAEQAEVNRSEIVTGSVKVETVTRVREARIQEMLASETAEVERVEIRELIDDMPDIRTEGDTVIVPVVEEVLVVERRLFLKEEVRIRRVRRTDLHKTTVPLREQEAIITRTGPPDVHARKPSTELQEADMASETIVAVFDTDAQARQAIAALEASGVSPEAIQHYAKDASNTIGDDREAAVEQRPQGGFWAWLTGEEQSQHAAHATLYDRSIESGGTVVTVITDDREAERIVSLLESHSPVDLEERGAQHGLTGTGTGTQTTTGASTATTGMTTTDTTTGTTAETPTGFGTATTGPTGTGTSGRESTEEVIPLSEETLEVGKRQVDRGTTRLRRYVVERPVEEQIRLRNETVSVFRRPASGAGAVGAEAFTDKTVEVRETAEEAVVAKNARVVEEVVVQKGIEERTETVRDTVRREEVEIDSPQGRNLTSEDPLANKR
jgi:uncharacterized protein (TIGR02271 family)